MTPTPIPDPYAGSLTSPAIVFLCFFTVLVFHGFISLVKKHSADIRKDESFGDLLIRTMKELEDKADFTVGLIEELRRDLAIRAREIVESEEALSRLQDEKKALELTEGQRKVIQSLVRRQPTLKDIFTSLDFWVNRVGVSTLFLVAGLLLGHLLKK